MKFFGQKEWVHLQLSVYELNVFLDVEFTLNIDLKRNRIVLNGFYSAKADEQSL